jgi:pimeloyl-ACP methyl ester carboxylesterase
MDQQLSYAELLGLVERQLTSEGKVVLLAESFSGAIALRLAVKWPGRVLAVALCGSFIGSPLPRWLRYLVGSALFSVVPPDFALRRFMVGKDAPDSLVAAVKQVIRKVRPGVMAGRLREVFALNCTDALRQCSAPLLYLMGEQDRLVGRANVDLIKKVRPDLKISSINGPHLLLQREPSAAWSAIVEFLKETNVLEVEGKFRES